MPTPTQLATRKLLTAGQARAQRLIDRIEAQTTGSAILEIGALRAMVRNLCAEVAMFDPEDGSIEVVFKGIHLWAHLESEQVQANGCDIGPLLSPGDWSAIASLADEKQREQRIDDAWDARQDALAQEQAA
jgi:hypothetical protein